METHIDAVLLNDLQRHYRSLGLKYRLKGLPYERCAELPWIVKHLAPRFGQPLQYLDIGSGESPLPTFLLRNSCWTVTCLDKCDWVQKQRNFLSSVMKPGSQSGRFNIIERDLLSGDLPAGSFDVITIISVIEHFEGNADTQAIEASARLLRHGGQIVLTTPMNDQYFREFYLNRTVYGSTFRGAPVYYQRHYDERTLQERIIGPSGLIETKRSYFGDYEFQCFERVLQRPKPIRAMYQWAVPWLAQRHLSYSDRPVSRKDMRMNTASGVMVVLEKPAHWA
jgi:SAM-dependent methyltransferase